LAKNGIIKSVQKSLKILKYITVADEEVSIVELEQEFGYNQSTIHHMLKTLNMEGFVSQNSSSKKYDIGPELFNVWLKYREAKNYFLRAYPLLKELSEETGETTNIFVREEEQAVCILGEESDKMLKAYLMIGRRVPLHCTAAGKAFLAYMPEEKVREILKYSGMKSYLRNTITDVDQLIAQLKKSKERGFTEDKEEFEELINAFGVPIFNKDGQVIATMSIVGPAMRLTDDKMEDIEKLVLSKANQIGAALSGKSY